VEYGDYECPHCGRAHPIVEEIRQQFGDRLRFVFRNFPLTQVHAHAEAAAEAAEAAGASGPLLGDASSLFTHQNASTPRTSLQHAGRLRINAAQLGEALSAHTFEIACARIHERSPQRGERHAHVLHHGMRHDAPFDLPFSQRL